MSLFIEDPYTNESVKHVFEMVRPYPRLRYMGSKYKVIPYLVNIFSSLQFETALDAFSGSGVVGYALKAMGKQVTTNDFLNFSATVSKATVENPGIMLEQKDLDVLLSPNADGRNFIQQTFQGLYFNQEDHAFLDAVWSHIHSLSTYKRDLAISALCLSVARKQPRGVFTVTTLKYDDGRRALHTPLKNLFIEAVEEYNNIVFDNGKKNKAYCKDIFEVDPNGFDLVYFDPPYVPLKDDNCYIKRYHFLEGLSVYWRGQKILENTKTKKIEKKFTPFSYKHTITNALQELFHRFKKSTIVLSYSSNSVPDKNKLIEILKKEKQDIQVYAIPYKYSFGTHSSVQRQKAFEYIFVAK